MKTILILLGIFLLIIFLEPVFEDVFNAATVVGVLAGVFTVVAGFVWDKGRGVQIVFGVLVFGGLALMLACMVIIYLFGRTTATDENVIIVLGCKVKGDTPSLSLVKRVDKAYDFLVRNPKSVAILSGGQGKDENISEAECMKNMLVEKGISPSRLLTETKSTTTRENIGFSHEIIRNLGLEHRVAIATSEYHQLRTRHICKSFGLDMSAQSSKTKPTILPTFILREFFALIKELIKY